MKINWKCLHFRTKPKRPWFKKPMKKNKMMTKRGIVFNFAGTVKTFAKEESTMTSKIVPKEKASMQSKARKYPALSMISNFTIKWACLIPSRHTNKLTVQNKKDTISYRKAQVSQIFWRRATTSNKNSALPVIMCSLAQIPKKTVSRSDQRYHALAHKPR